MRFLIPEGGVSAIDRPGQPFHDPEADRALFAAIDERLPRRRRPQAACACRIHINDDAFADALVAAWHDVAARRAGAPSLDRESPCPASLDKTLLERFRAKIAARPADRSAAAPAPACRPSARRPAAST